MGDGGSSGSDGVRKEGTPGEAAAVALSAVFERALAMVEQHECAADDAAAAAATCASSAAAVATAGVSALPFGSSEMVRLSGSSAAKTCGSAASSAGEVVRELRAAATASS